MKKRNYLLTMFMALFISFQPVGCSRDNAGDDTEQSNIDELADSVTGSNDRYLVLYCSRTGNTESVARQIILHYQTLVNYLGWKDVGQIKVHN
ncbi:MAG: hypothetical protein LBE71_02180 [Dysgonamonadaceae bacterium]|jgi:sulfite reductase alpha subunit-like flavoprotein|nr:hypothetical protein [Dysgonamonadaceae bacterium]